MGYAPYGGSDIAECLAVAERVTSASADLWYREWRELADRTHARAVASLQAGNGASARGGFWRAATYYRTAGLFDLQRPVSDRLREAHRREIESFRSGAALMRIPPQIVEIPSPDGPLPGYFFRASEGGAPRGTVILTNGYDGTAEELYFASGAERRAPPCRVPVRLRASGSPGVTARRLPRVLAAQLPDGDPRLLRVLDRLLRGVMARPRVG